MLDEGVYGLRFDLLPSEGDAGAGLSACGDGLAVLRGGQILGSDRYGGVFKGCYRYDAVRGEALVEVRVDERVAGTRAVALEASGTTVPFQVQMSAPGVHLVEARVSRASRARTGMVITPNMRRTPSRCCAGSSRASSTAAT